MKQEEKQLLAAVESSRNNAGFFEPRNMVLPRRIPVYCPCCRTSYRMAELTLFHNQGMMDEAYDLPEKEVSIIASCPKCGSRISISRKELKKKINKLSAGPRNVILVLLLLVAGGVSAFTALSRMSRERYLDMATQQRTEGAFEQAAESYRKAQKFGSADAGYYLSEFYRTGMGVTADTEMADTLLLEAEKDGSRLAKDRRTSLMLDEYAATEDAGLLETALDRLQSNGGQSLYERSLMSRAGVMSGDAEELLYTAASAGYLPAICDLAKQMQYNDDPQAARNLLYSYPDQNEPEIQAGLAWLDLFSGRGEQAYGKLQEAAAAGSATACAYLGDAMAYGLTAEGPDFDRAWEYYTQAVNAGRGSAMVGQVLCMYQRSSKYYDPEAAGLLAQQCVRRGYTEALTFTALARDTANQETALQELQQAAEWQYAPAELALAEKAHENGDTAACTGYLQLAYLHGARRDANKRMEAWYGAAQAFGADSFF